MADPRVVETITSSNLTPAAQADVRDAIDSSPYLQSVMLKGVQENRIRELGASNDPNQGGYYNLRKGAISFSADYLAIEDRRERLDVLTGVIGHEAGHALMARSAEISANTYLYDVTNALRQASQNGDPSVDVTPFAKRAIEDFRSNEGFAELVSMNAVASRVAHGSGGFSLSRFLERADAGTQCIEDGVLAKGIQVNAQGIQVTGGQINSPAVERVAECHFDDGANTLGLKGTSSYNDRYAAYMVGAAAGAANDYARGTTGLVPQIELNLQALRSSARGVQDAGVELGGEGKIFDFIDTSAGQRRAVTVRQAGPQGAPQPDAPADLGTKPLLADDPAHPDHGTFNRIHEWVRGTGHWDDSKSLNVTSALYREVADTPLVRRVDSVVGARGQDGSENVFAVYAPFGDKGPFFRAQVDGRQVAQQPAQESLQQAEGIMQDRAQVQAVEQQQRQDQTKPMQPTR